MPVDENPLDEAPDNAERTSQRDAFARQGATMVVAVPAAPAVLQVNMRKLGLTGRHVRFKVVGAAPCSYFLEAVKTAGQTVPDSTVRATFDVAGTRTANPAGQAAELAVDEEARRYVSSKFPMLRMNGIGAVSVIEIEDATI